MKFLKLCSAWKKSQRDVVNILYFTTLFFTQGLLYGFQTRFLPLYLRDQGLSFSVISFVRLLTLPCLLKSIWAPYIDRSWVTYDWIVINLAGNFFCLLSIGLSTSYEDAAFFISVFAMNVFTATQDVALAKAMIKDCADNEALLLKASCCKVLGYKIGNLFGGGIVIWLATLHHQTTTLIVGLGCFHLLLGCIVSRKGKLIAIDVSRTITRSYTKFTSHLRAVSYANSAAHNMKPEPVKQSPKLMRVFEERKYADAKSPTTNTKHVLKTIALELVSDVGLLWMAAFSFFYRLGPQAGHSLFSFYLLDNGVPLWKVGIMIGVYSQLVNVLCSAIGGIWLSSKSISMEQLQALALFLSLFPVLLQLVIIRRQADVRLEEVIASITLEQACFGLSSTAIQASMLKYASRTDKSATSLTCYTFIATLESLGKLASSAIALVVVPWFGYSLVYSLSILFIIFSWVLLYCRPSDKVRRRKRTNATILVQPRQM